MSIYISNIEIKWIGGYCPVQAEGSIEYSHNGETERRDFLFRARHDSWLIQFNFDNELLKGSKLIGCGKYGERFDAGYMSIFTALRIIADAFEKWSKSSEELIKIDYPKEDIAK